MLGSTLPTPRSTPARPCTSCCHFDGCFGLFCCVCHRFARSLIILILWLLCRTPFTRIAFLNMFFFQNPGLHRCFGLNKNQVFASKPSFTPVFYTKCCLKQKPCCSQTPCFTQKNCSCWACASAFCGLQDSSFHGGRRNTPKAFKYCICICIYIFIYVYLKLYIYSTRWGPQIPVSIL